ncbi:CBS domain-containing protein [Enterococcus dongliensis]|uniref:CBS domain-containing protein n=1 Tax=Enterococcus dongliensis TaxID=2559925 RepID=A0AAP5KUQ1_9ENTE|nr:cyclic-di-AMP-binding protein CbpB [Enterococcus dongliensis]MDT2595720.1 CBS domain-containing protein [Enterococcus dongliensis]MDT2602680.1 CBS domain-containing protein [Enterococcus dongliensis]MDT2612141.1 CBS domain-containing protein [Enterococcus dongliensis]MDT2633832.1 CBS domain-containing protein [Enterococcus dongliensis]MDT2636333.1 CBS domain-containing protein [Enterococcus dongliensis]
MISPAIEQLMKEHEETMMIPAENVANVIKEHPLEHALLLLSQAGYSTIPVLDKEDHFVGLLSLNDIVKRMLGIDGIDTSNLEKLTVADVMKTDVSVMRLDAELEDILHLLVDAAFLPVLDQEGVFCGIVTRREILKAVNYTFHTFERKNHETKLIFHANSPR